MASNPPPTDPETGERDEPGETGTNPAGVSTTEPAEGSDDTPGGGVQSPGHSERDLPADPD
ncbi:hypothetical protein [Sphingomonas spermidinifaciens]|uniref:hypothetical protein n=1 Tax=Sphingomonas spermidinifaciens TaxID=1141889 RepID=UPI00159653E8|nr:hypothetical protein [Sphingomonas spermidinifaciens]